MTAYIFLLAGALGLIYTVFDPVFRYSRGIVGTVAASFIFGTVFCGGLFALAFPDQLIRVKNSIAVEEEPYIVDLGQSSNKTTNEGSDTFREECKPFPAGHEYVKFELTPDHVGLDQPPHTIFECAEQMKAELLRCRNANQSYDSDNFHTDFSMRGDLDVGVKQVFDNGVCTYFLSELSPFKLIEKELGGREYLLPLLSDGGYRVVPFLLNESSAYLFKIDDREIELKKM